MLQGTSTIQERPEFEGDIATGILMRGWNGGGIERNLETAVTTCGDFGDSPDVSRAAFWNLREFVRGGPDASATTMASEAGTPSRVTTPVAAIGPLEAKSSSADSMGPRPRRRSAEGTMENGSKSAMMLVAKPSGGLNPVGDMRYPPSASLMCRGRGAAKLSPSAASNPSITPPCLLLVNPIDHLCQTTSGRRFSYEHVKGVSRNAGCPNLHYWLKRLAASLLFSLRKAHKSGG